MDVASKDLRRRLDIRVPPHMRRLLEVAAQAAGETLTVFILKAALSRARVHIFDDALLSASEHELRKVQFPFMR